jgi:hypothetical protein
MFYNCRYNSPQPDYSIVGLSKRGILGLAIQFASVRLHRRGTDLAHRIDNNGMVKQAKPGLENIDHPLANTP